MREDSLASVKNASNKQSTSSLRQTLFGDSLGENIEEWEPEWVRALHTPDKEILVSLSSAFFSSKIHSQASDAPAESPAKPTTVQKQSDVTAPPQPQACLLFSASTAVSSHNEPVADSILSELAESESSAEAGCSHAAGTLVIVKGEEKALAKHHRYCAVDKRS